MSRIVTIAPGATEIVVAAGGLSRIVGVSNVDSAPPEVLQLPSFSVLPMDFETIVSLEPDLVFASSQVNDPQQVRVFESLGLNVFFLDGSTWESVYESIGKAGQLLFTEEKAASSMNDLSFRIESLVQKTATLNEKPRAIFLISDVTSYSFGKGSYVIDVFSWAGITLASEDLDTPAPKLSDEWVLLEDPEFIFGTFGENFQAEDLLKHHPTWKNLRAIQNGNVYSVPQDLILRPGPGNVDASYLLAQAAHPDLFQTAGN